jgi:RND family efflux transporter MFP subunit
MQTSNLLDLQTPRERQHVPPPRVHWWSRVVVPATIVAGVALLLIGATWRNFLPVETVRVEAAIAKQVGTHAPASTVVQAAGWLEAFPYQTHITALADGVAEEILVLEGDSVTAGQVVARLNATDAEIALRKAKADLAMRQKELVEAEAHLKAAKETWENPIALEQAKATADATVRRQQATVTEIEARIAQQAAVVNQARRDADRAEQLSRDEIVSKQEAEQARSTFDAANSALDALKRSLAAGTELLERAKADLVAATRNFELRIADRQVLEAAEAATLRAEAALQRAEADLADAQIRLARMTIRSPIDGIVVTRHKAPGDKVMLRMDGERSATVFSLYEAFKLQARVDVPLADAGQIAVGQRCEVSTDVLPNRTFEGEVIRVLHEADIQKNTLQAKVVISDPSPELRPEMLCRVRFMAMPRPEQDGETTFTRIFVPEQAVVDDRVWLARMTDAPFATLEPLSAAGNVMQDGWRAIDGLQPGARVVVNPPTDLDAGQRVRVVESGQGGQL